MQRVSKEPLDARSIPLFLTVATDILPDTLSDEAPDLSSTIHVKHLGPTILEISE